MNDTRRDLKDSSGRLLKAFSENILATFPACKARVGRASGGRVRRVSVRARGRAAAGAGRAAIRAGRARDARAGRLGDADARGPKLVREARAALLADDSGLPRAGRDGDGRAPGFGAR